MVDEKGLDLDGETWDGLVDGQVVVCSEEERKKNRLEQHRVFIIGNTPPVDDQEN